MFKTRDRNADRKIRHARVRRKISGTPEMPRLCVYRSLNNIYAQVIDDTKGVTLVACSTQEKDVMAQIKDTDKKGAAKIVGKLIAERASEDLAHFRGTLCGDGLRAARAAGSSFCHYASPAFSSKSPPPCVWPCQTS